MVHFAGAATPLGILAEGDGAGPPAAASNKALRSRHTILVRASTTVAIAVSLCCVVVLGYYKGASDYAAIPNAAGPADPATPTPQATLGAPREAAARESWENIENDHSLALPRHLLTSAGDSKVLPGACATMQQAWRRPGEERGSGLRRAEGDKEIDVAVIVNVAILTYQFITSNEPSMDVQYDFANAIPEGIRLKEQHLVTGWSDPESRPYHFSASNRLGREVVAVDYAVIFQHGGSYKGVGRYLTHVSIVPCKTWVSFGNTLNAKVTAHDVINAGSKEAPVAAMTVDIQFEVMTWTLTQQFVESFYITGEGKLTKLA